MRSSFVSSRSEEAPSVVFIFVTAKTQVARLWCEDPPAMLTAFSTRFCFKFTSVSDACTAPHLAIFFETRGVMDTVRSLRGGCW